MSPFALLFAYGWSIALGAALLTALALAARHHRASRVARYVRDPGAAIHEGPALVLGVVEADDEDASPEPVLAVEIAPHAARTAVHVRARPFGLRLPSGALLRVEPEEDPERLALDQTYRPAGRRYEAEIRPGDEICLGGEVRREIDRRATGRGYRDAAVAWVLRPAGGGPLRLVSIPLIALHARRARFHASWALGLGAGLLVQQLGPLRPAHAALGPGGLAGAARAFSLEGFVLAVLLGVVLLAAYHLSAEGTRPWLDRRVR